MENNNLFRKVYLWMTIALVISGLTAMWVDFNPAIQAVVLSQGMCIGLVVTEFALVIALSYFLEKLSTTTAMIMFILFSMINGATLSVIFLIYEIGSIVSTFFITAGTFAAMSIYGYLTKTDLSKFGNLLFMGLISLIIAGFVNWFIQSTVFDMVISCVGVLVFVGLTAYDTQKIKEVAPYSSSDKIALFGALTLYLDFVNLFLYLLKLLGNKK